MLWTKQKKEKKKKLMKKRKCFVENSFYVLVDNSFFNSSFFKLKKYVLFKLEKKTV